MDEHLTKSQKIAFVVFPIVLILLVIAGRGQSFVSGTSASPCAAPQSPDPFNRKEKVYHIKVKSPFQADQIEYRKEITSLINETFADEEKGIWDRKKYDRIKALARKLKNPAAKELR